MVFKQGNTYELPVNIKNTDLSTIQKIVFKFNDIEKEYDADDENSEVREVDGQLILPFSQEETLSLCENVAYEVAVRFKSGKVKKSLVKYTQTLITIIKEVI